MLNNSPQSLEKEIIKLENSKILPCRNFLSGCCQVHVVPALYWEGSSYLLPSGAAAGTDAAQKNTSGQEDLEGTNCKY